MTGKKLTNSQKAAIIVLHEEKLSTRKISNRLRISQSSIARAIKFYKENETIEYPNKPGKKQTLTNPMLKSIIKEVKLNPSLTSNELKNMAKDWYDIDITASCIRKRLIQKGYTKHSIFKKPRLTEKQKKMRLE